MVQLLILNRMLCIIKYNTCSQISKLKYCNNHYKITTCWHSKQIHFTSVAKLWLAPFARRYLTTLSWFSWAAMYKGVNPFWLWTLTDAPYWTRSLTTSSCPAKEAMCKAVLPFFVAASTTAPRLRSSSTTWTWPSFDAKWRAFNPFWGRKNREYCRML